MKDSVLRLVVTLALAVLNSSTDAASWTGPMPIVPGTDHTSGAVIRQDHTQYVIPPAACENFKQYEVCWKSAPPKVGVQEKCADRFPWKTASANWNRQIKSECKVDLATIQAARRSTTQAGLPPPKLPTHAASKEGKGVIRTYVCSVQTSEGTKRRVAWERSVDAARARAYESYAPIATVKQDQIDCKLR